MRQRRELRRLREHIDELYAVFLDGARQAGRTEARPYPPYSPIALWSDSVNDADDLEIWVETTYRDVVPVEVRFVRLFRAAQLPKNG